VDASCWGSLKSYNALRTCNSHFVQGHKRSPGSRRRSTARVGGLAMRKVWSHDWIVCPGMRARELSDKGDKSPVALVAALAIKRTEAQSREIASLLSWVAVALIECDEKQVRYCACGNSCAGQEQVVISCGRIDFLFLFAYILYTKHFQIASSQVQQFLECWLLSSLRTFCNFFLKITLKFSVLMLKSQ